MRITSVKKGSRAAHRARMAAVGLGAALLISGSAMSASAAPVTEPVNWAANSGTTPSGVSWTGRGGLANAGNNVTQGVTRTLTFSEPVTATFNVQNVNGWGGGTRECVRLPANVTLTRLDPDNSWNAATRTLCYRGPAGTSADGNTNGNTASYFRTTGPVTQLSLTGTSGSTSRQSALRGLQITTDDAPPVPMIAPGLAAAGVLAAGALACVRRLRDTKSGTGRGVPTQEA